jgi:hypothetical protein
MALYTKITRYGTEAEWLAADPVLSKGEIVVVSDKEAEKRGDGVSLFSALPYRMLKRETSIKTADYVLTRNDRGVYGDVSLGALTFTLDDTKLSVGDEFIVGHSGDGDVAVNNITIRSSDGAAIPTYSTLHTISTAKEVKTIQKIGANKFIVVS